MAADPRTKLTLVQIQKLRGIPARTLRGAIERGRLPAERIGPLYLVALADLDAYLASKYQTRRPGSRSRRPVQR